MPPDERVGPHDGEERSPIDQARERDEGDSRCIIQTARPDLRLDVEGQLPTQEEVLGCEAGVGRTDQGHELQDITYEQECGANHPCRS